MIRHAKATSATSALCAGGISRLVVGLALALFSLLVIVSPAGALTDGYTYSHSFGSSGSGNGQFFGDLGVGLAIEQSTGNVYLADIDNHRVLKFNSAGTFLQAWGYGVSDGQNQSEVCTAPSPCQAGLSGTAPGQFRQPSGIAVDNSSGPNQGDVFVVEGGTGGGGVSDGAILKFDSNGIFLDKIDGSESDTGTFENLPWQGAVAVDDNGFLWVASGQVMKFSNGADNEFVPGSEWDCGCFGGVRGISPNGTGTRLLIGAYSNGIETPYITSAGGTVIVDHLPCGGSFSGDTAFDSGTGNFFVANGGSVCVFTQKGEMVGSPFGGGQLGGTQGIAVNATSGDVYVEDNSRVAVFVPRVVPDVTTGAVTGLGHTGATLTGQAAPDPAGGGNVSGCHFEVGTDTSYGTNLPCVPATPYSAATPVTADVSGLSMETTYHYRLVAANSVDSTGGADRTFTPRAVLGLSTDPATSVTPASATLNGSFEPNNEETHYHFEWGPDTSYGNTTPVTLGWATGSPPGNTTASAPISGLSSFTKYHYRIVAVNGVGTSYGEDHAFTTAPPEPPVISASAASDVTADTATISASLNPKFGGTYYGFEYGTSSLYGSEISEAAPIEPDDAGHPISAALTGLEPGTTYHFRVVAINFGGTSHGPDVVFSTLDLPTIALAGSASVTRSGAVLTAAINPGHSPTSFHFEYGQSPAYGSATRESAPIGSDGTSHSIAVPLSGLAAGTTYYFRVVATNGLGTRASDDHVFTTAPPPVSETPPPPTKCETGFVRRNGHCVKKHHKRKHRRHHRGGAR